MSMARMEILREELQLPIYATLTDDQCAQALNAPKQGFRPVEIRELTNSLSAIGKLVPILRAARANIAAAVDLMDSLNLAQLVGQTTIRLDDETVIGIMVGLQTATLLSDDDITHIQSMSAITTTHADELGIGGVSTGDVSEARL